MSTPPTDPLSQQELVAWRGLLQVHARVTRALDAQMRAEHGISLSAYEVLMFLAAAPKHRLRKTPLHQSERAMAARAGRPGES